MFALSLLQVAAGRGERADQDLGDRVRRVDRRVRGADHRAIDVGRDRRAAPSCRSRPAAAATPAGSARSRGCTGRRCPRSAGDRRGEVRERGRARAGSARCRAPGCPSAHSGGGPSSIRIGLIPARTQAVDRRVDDAPAVLGVARDSRPGSRAAARPTRASARRAPTTPGCARCRRRSPASRRHGVGGGGAAAEQDRVVGDPVCITRAPAGARGAEARPRAARRAVRCTGSQPVKLPDARGVALSRSASSPRGRLTLRRRSARRSARGPRAGRGPPRRARAA